MLHRGLLLWAFVVLLFVFAAESNNSNAGAVAGAVAGAHPQCPTNHKVKVSADGSISCVQLENEDVIRAMHFLAKPPKTTCQRTTVVQGISVCEDDMPQDCLIWSVISAPWCNNIGSMEFEKYWSKRCTVYLFHYTAYFKGNNCAQPATGVKGEWGEEFPNMIVERHDLWEQRQYTGFYTTIKALPLEKQVNVLKVSERGYSLNVTDDNEGVQYTILSDLFLHHPGIEKNIDQIIFRTTFSTQTLFDSVGREAENMYNMWGSQNILDSYGAFNQTTRVGAKDLMPNQFEQYLSQADITTQISHYITSYKKISEEEKAAHMKTKMEWKPLSVEKIRGEVPQYCSEPSTEDIEFMHTWIDEQLKLRCHPTRLWVPCEARTYDNFVPCPQDLANALAEDFSAARGWCNYNSQYAAIPPLKVPEEVEKAFSKESLPNSAVRIAFFFIVHTDVEMTTRLLDRLYNQKHYYLIHIDPAGSSAEYEAGMREVAAKRPNVFIVKDVIIVYGASTVTMLLTKAMAWFNQYAKGWDYMVPMTGSDYPLVPLPQIEKILAHQKPHMPFVMAWTAGTQTHIFRLGKTHPRFVNDEQLRRSIEVMNLERGKIMGQVPMEFRSGNFGPPLTCKNQRGFAHLDNRRNDSGRFDTQWLFPRDPWPRRGRANADENPNIVVPPIDGKFRVWKKSDPAFTAAYDKETIEYIVNSEEGRKYWHFFKHMLLASEEHYYVSLLYNWPRTKGFISSLSAQSTWNTWELGLPNQMQGGFRTHTHYLGKKEFDYIVGMSRRGVFFARKFALSKNRDVLDMIDKYLLLNTTSGAGHEWPGFFEVDMASVGREWVRKFNQQQRQRQMANKFRDNDKK